MVSPQVTLLYNKNPKNISTNTNFPGILSKRDDNEEEGVHCHLNYLKQEKDDKCALEKFEINIVISLIESLNTRLIFTVS